MRQQAFRLTEEQFADHEAGRPIAVPERDVLADVLAFLKRHPKIAFAVRMGSGVARFGNKDGPVRFVQFGFKGCPDVWAMFRGTGRLLVVECKSTDGALSEEQRAVLDAVRIGGGVSVVARSIEDVANALEAV